MPSEVEIKVERAIRSLGERIVKAVIIGLSDGALTAISFDYVRDRLDEVEHTEHGLHVKRRGVEFFTKPSWAKASGVVLECVRETEEFQAAYDSLSETSLSPHDVKTLLEQFTKRLAYKLLETPNQPERQEYLEYLLSIVLKHFNGQQLLHSAEVRLEGLLIIPESIEFDATDTKIRLRPVVEQDLLNEEIYLLFRERFRETPSAILNVEFLGHHDNAHEIQYKIDQAITILRLFKVGSVHYLSYKTDSETLTDIIAPHAGQVDNYQYGGVGRYRIEDADVSRLKEFWQRLIQVLPKDGYRRGKINVESISIAYQRYWDAILTRGGVERRISDAVMGLESLFLKGSEKQESVYRLRMRVAKVLGFLGYDPHTSKWIANDAYAIRSAFVHGDNVDKNAKRQVDRRHGDFNKLSKLVLDQLRISIVLMTLLGQEKENFVALIDDSFIDDRRLSELQTLVAPIKGLL